MGTCYLRSLVALRRLRPLLTKELYESFLAAASCSGRALGMQALLEDTIELLKQLPSPGELQHDSPRAALRFVFPKTKGRIVYLLESPELLTGEGAGNTPVLAHEESRGDKVRLSISDLLSSGACLDITYDPIAEGMPV